jgi:endonuclease YncB( thermonuclease family)
LSFLYALVLLFAAGVTHADTLVGGVVVVIDGDTVLFRPDSYGAASRAFLKVRLVDIDAPETDQPYGDAATDALKSLALGRQASLEIVATDVYGRKLGRLAVGGLQVNAELVRSGHAWAASRDRTVRALEREARRARRGLWQDQEAVAPWAWRRARAASTRRWSAISRGVPSGRATWHSSKMRALQRRHISLSSLG